MTDTAVRLSEAQRRELIRVRDHGKSKTKAGYFLRVKNLTEFLWKLKDGTILGNSEVSQTGWFDQMQGAVCIGERLTPAGRAALTQGRESKK